MSKFNLTMKKFFLLLIILFLFYIFWLGFNILMFKTYKTSTSTASPLEIEGVYHIHTTFSDGKMPMVEIVKLASQAALDFIILTDHGIPEDKSYWDQGWKEGVLVLAGSELSLSRGHLAALGFELPSNRFSGNTERAVYEIEAKGGFSIICHPYSKVSWSWGEFIDYSGIEIINAYTMLKEDIFPSLPYFPALWLKPEYALLKMLDRPYRNLRKWDELNNIHPIYGYFSLDAHRFYRPLLNLLHLHLMLQSPLAEDTETAKHQVYEALRAGRFYNSVHAAAHARGFRFWGEKGNVTIPMGSTALLDYPVNLHVQTPFPFAKEIHLIHNGRKIFQPTEENTSYEATQPGTYRVEVYIKARSPMAKDVPWIISNPIFLREDKK